METKYPLIRDGEKIKFTYMREPNPVSSTAIAFPTKLPPEFKLDEYIDWEMQWTKSFIEPLKLILNAIQWDTEERASLDFLFEDQPETTTIDTSLYDAEDEEDEALVAELDSL
jgi:DNA polymerase elongation subunit (family B)